MTSMDAYIQNVQVLMLQSRTRAVYHFYLYRAYQTQMETDKKVFLIVIKIGRKIHYSDQN
jgi:hypothetical protein